MLLDGAYYIRGCLIFRECFIPLQGNTGLHHAVSSANHGVMNILMGCEGLNANHKNQVCNSVVCNSVD